VLLQVIDATKVIPILRNFWLKKNGNNLCCINELKQHFVDLQWNVIDAAINEWIKQLRACVRAERQHFEHYCELLIILKKS